MAVLSEVKTVTGDHSGWLFECPGCGHAHLFDRRWTFDGNHEKPSFTPSLLTKVNDKDSPHYQKHALSSVCHLYVTGGRIRYLDDCTHGLRGQTVDMVDMDEPLKEDT